MKIATGRDPDCIAFLQWRCRNWNATNEEAFRCVFHMREEFPDQGLLIERLEKTNCEFERLAAAYDEVNRQSWRIESEDESTLDEVLEKLKKRRLLLKDDIAALIASERGGN